MQGRCSTGYNLCYWCKESKEMNNGQVNPHSDSSAAVHCSWAVMRHTHTFHLGSNQVLWVISKAPHKNLTQRERQRGLRDKWSWGGGGGLGEETGRKGKESRRGAKEGNRRGEERVSPRGELNDINDALVWSGCESQQSPSPSTCYHGCCCCCWHPDSRAQIMKSGGFCVCVFLCVCEERCAQKCSSVCVLWHNTSHVYRAVKWPVKGTRCVRFVLLYSSLPFPSSFFIFPVQTMKL